MSMRFHVSKLTSKLMPITGRKNDYFEDFKNKYRLIDRIKKNIITNVDPEVSGVLLRNYARDYMRVQW